MACGRLLTNEEHTRRGMTIFPFCDHCGLDVESIMHTVRDSTFPRAIWRSIVPRRLWNDFFSLLVIQWIPWNIRNEGKIVYKYGEWLTFFFPLCVSSFGRIEMILFSNKPVVVVNPC